MASTVVAPERLDIVEELWRRCVSNAQIEAQLAKQWQVTRRTIRSYIAKVVTRNGNMRPSVVDEAAQRAEFQRTLSMFEAIYLRAFEGEGEKGKGKELRTALQAVHRRAQLLGLYPASRYEVTGANGQPLQVSPDAALAQLERQIALMEARSGATPAPAATAVDHDQGGG